MPIGSLIGRSDLHYSIVWRMFFAEFVGTFLYVFIGVLSSAENTSTEQEMSVQRTGFAFGLTLTCVLQIIGPISGAHINPAVSISYLIIGESTIEQCISYIIIQCCGAILAALLIRFLTPAAVAGVTLTTSSDASVWQHLLTEVVITFIMVLLVLISSDPYRRDFHSTAALVVGLTVVLCTLACYTIEGASMNPARSLGPALVYAEWRAHWIYWIGPIVGAIMAAWLYRTVSEARLRRRRRVRISI